MRSGPGGEQSMAELQGCQKIDFYRTMYFLKIDSIHR